MTDSEDTFNNPLNNIGDRKTAVSGAALGGLVGLAEQSILADAAPSASATTSLSSRKRSLAPAPMYPASGPKLPLIGREGGNNSFHDDLEDDNADDGSAYYEPAKRANSLVFGLENAEDLALTADDSDDDGYGGGGAGNSRGPHAGASNAQASGSNSRAGRRKIKIEFIDDKSRRHITFSKRKAGIMKKAYELSTLTGTQVLLLVASETGHVYTFATPKLQPLITKPEGKNLIQACLNAPEPSDLLHAATGHPSLGQVPPPSMAPSSVPSSLQQSRSNSVSQLAVLDGNGLPHYPPCGNPAASNNALNNGSASSSTGMAYASSGGYIDPYAHHHQHLPHLAHMQPSEPGDEDDLSPRQ